MKIFIYFSAAALFQRICPHIGYIGAFLAYHEAFGHIKADVIYLSAFLTAAQIFVDAFLHRSALYVKNSDNVAAVDRNVASQIKIFLQYLFLPYLFCEQKAVVICRFG